jgi:hypothetical protein
MTPDHKRPDCFPLPLDGEWLELGRNKRYRLNEPFAQVEGNICIWCESGFVTDFASVPKPFDPLDTWGWAAVPHDKAYKSGEIPRPVADSMFLVGMKRSGTPKWKRWGGYLAVRLRGWKYYNYREEQDEVNGRIAAVKAGFVGLLIIAGCALFCSGCTATKEGSETGAGARAGISLPFNLGFDAETGFKVGFTGPLTGNEYEAAIPVTMPNLPFTVKTPAPAPTPAPTLEK